MKISKEQALTTTQDVWVVDLHESELGGGSESWSEFYTTYGEAHDQYSTVNAENPEGDVPDYYIVASEPHKLNPPS